MNDKYILVDGVVTPEPDLIKWAKWYEKTDDRMIERHDGENFVISTVFLGLDHSFGDGPPLLFETMVFKRNDWDDRKSLPEQDMVRYATIEQAQVGHDEMVAKWEAATT